MKILVIGHFENKWSTNNEMVNALRNMKNDVDVLDYRKFYRKHYGLFYQLILKLFSFFRSINFPILSYFYYTLHGGTILEKQIIYQITIHNYDFIILLKTDTLNPYFIKSIKQKTSAKIIYYFMDALDIAKKIRVEKYSIHTDLSTLISDELCSYFNTRYQTNFKLCQQGVLLSNWTGKSKHTTQETYDVIFIGSADQKRKKIINFLLKNNIKVECFGQGWENSPIYSDDLINKMNSSKIVLNFTRDKLSYSVRIMQALISRNFVISSFSTALNKDFVDGEHLVIYYNKNDLLSKIHFYLENQKKRYEISEKGKLFVSQNYNWEKIIQKNITSMGKF